MEIARLQSSTISTFSPLVGGALVSLLYLGQPDLGVGAASLGTLDRFSIQRQVLRFAAVLLVVGSGNALALAGPAAEMGMTVARVFSGGANRRGGLSRPLILAGSAAGFAANFDAPLAGSLYALEVSRRAVFPWRPDAQERPNKQQVEVSMTMIAAFAAAAVIRGRAGGFSSYTRGPLALPVMLPIPASGLPLLLAVGAATGLLASFIQGPLANVVTSLVSCVPKVIRPLLGGSLVSTAASASELPQSLPAIYKVFAAMADGKLSPDALMRFMAVKVVSIQACLSSGLIGGTIAPYLIVGSSIGALIATVSSRVPIASFAAVGSAAVLASLFQAPLAFAVLIVEMTQQFHLLAPLLLVSAVSSYTCELASGALDWKKAAP